MEKILLRENDLQVRYVIRDLLSTLGYYVEIEQKTLNPENIDEYDIVIISDNTHEFPDFTSYSNVLLISDDNTLNNSIPCHILYRPYKMTQLIDKIKSIKRHMWQH